MNDFLANLVTRSLEPQAELQPRMASRFEQAELPRVDVALGVVLGEGESVPPIAEVNTDQDALPRERTHDGAVPARKLGAQVARDQNPGHMTALRDLTRESSLPNSRPLLPNATPTPWPSKTPEALDEPKPQLDMKLKQPPLTEQRNDLAGLNAEQPTYAEPNLPGLAGSNVVAPKPGVERNRPSPVLVEASLPTAIALASAIAPSVRPDPPALPEVTVVERIVHTEARHTTHQQPPEPQTELGEVRPQTTTNPARPRQPEATPAPASIQPRIQVLPAAPPQTQSAPAPTIHVTIGRVEVRAAAPAQPNSAPKPAARKPALSLDDYLHQRANPNGGGR